MLSKGSNVKQLLYLSIIFYSLTLCLVKCSLILSYIRIFAHSRTRQASWVVLLFVILYNFTTIVAAIFTCWPIAAFWDFSIEGARCINKSALYFSNAGCSIFSDFAILILPIPALITLHLPRQQKVGIMLIFAIGSFACISSILRLYYLYVTTVAKDITWAYAGGVIWSCVEINIFIICACLTGLKPLFGALLARLPKSITGGSRGANPRHGSFEISPIWDSNDTVRQKNFARRIKSNERLSTRDEDIESQQTVSEILDGDRPVS